MRPLLRSTGLQGSRGEECHCFYCLVMILDLTHLFLNFFKLLFFIWDWSWPPMFTPLMFIPFHMFYVSHFIWSHGQEESLLYYDLFDFRVIILWMHPDPHFLFLLLSPLLPPQPHPCNTHHPSPHSMAWSREEYDQDLSDEEPVNLIYTEEDSSLSTQGIATALMVLPSMASAQWELLSYQGPSSD